MHYNVISEIHRLPRAKGSGAWKSITTYRFSEGMQMIESNSYLSGRDRYDDHSERLSDDNGKTWFDEKLVFPSECSDGNVIRACEVFLDLDTQSNTLFRVYNHGCYENDADDMSGINSFTANSHLMVQMSKDGGQTYSEPIDITVLSRRRGGIFEKTNTRQIKPGVSCSHLEVLPDGTLLIPIHYWNSATKNNTCNSAGHEISLDQRSGIPVESVAMLIGRWKQNINEIDWNFSERIPFRVDQTTHLTESSVVALNDGRVLCVARGDGGRQGVLPSYKWLSVSADAGQTWSHAEPLTYTDGQPLNSPSTCCRLLRHSDGQLYLITNIFEHECYGGGPRNALHMIEIDEDRLKAIKSSLILLDRHKTEESLQMALSNFHVYEDRVTKEICVMCPKTFAHQWGSDYVKFDYGDSVCMCYRIDVNA